MTAPLQLKRHFPMKFGILIFSVILMGFIVWHFTRPKPLNVTLATVERGLVESTISNTRSGSIKACHRAKLAAPSGGQITALLVKKGDRVKANQILLELWDKDLRVQQQLALIQLKTTQIQSQQSCLQAELTEQEANRAQRLYEQKFISTEALEQKNSAAKITRAGCTSALSQVEQTRIHIAATQVNVDRMVLRAPFNGIIADINGELGEYATPSPPGIPTPPVIDLIDDSCVFVSAPIDEVDAANIKVGQSSRITLDAIKGKSYSGTIKRIAPYILELEKQARTVEVEVNFIDRPSIENLLVGYSADIEIVFNSRTNVLRIPTQALLENKRVLRLIPENHTLEERSVVIGATNWEYTEVISGLNLGDRIAIPNDQVGVKAGVMVTTSENLSKKP